VNQNCVHFDCDQAFGAIDEMLGERAFARPDFYECPAGLGTGRFCNAFEDRFANEKVLPQPASGHEAGVIP
jgi:hypothetical protein